jgi:hypothetical protein
MDAARDMALDAGGVVGSDYAAHVARRLEEEARCEVVCVECDEPFEDGGCGLVDCPHAYDALDDDDDDDGVPF